MQPSRKSVRSPREYQATSSAGMAIGLVPGSGSQLHTNGHAFSSQRNPFSNNNSRTGFTHFATREQLRQDHPDHSFRGSHHAREQYLSNMSTDRLSHLHADGDRHHDSGVRPLPRKYGSTSFGVRYEERQHKNDGVVQHLGYRLDSGEYASPTRSFPSPSTSIVDVDRDARPRIKVEVGEEATNAAAPNSRLMPSKVDDAPQATTTKSSRYLREVDRRMILWRLTNGEKQASLAKEFHVSRSTICNLYKQRQAVWARHDENPLSLHPKRSRRKLGLVATVSAERSPSADSCTDSKDGNDAEEKQPAPIFQGVVLEVKSRALSLLLTTVRDRETSQAHFRRCCSRAMRLLLEESLPRLDTSQTLGFLDSLHTSKPLYAVSLERHGSVALESFREIEPHSQSTSFWPLSGRGGRFHENPGSLEHCNVVVLDLVTSSVDLVRAVVRTLRGCGVQQARISLVSLFITAEVVTRVKREYPSVRIFTASIDSTLETNSELSKLELESVSRSFLERFHTLEC